MKSLISIGAFVAPWKSFVQFRRFFWCVGTKRCFSFYSNQGKKVNVFVMHSSNSEKLVFLFPVVNKQHHRYKSLVKEHYIWKSQDHKKDDQWVKQKKMNACCFLVIDLHVLATILDCYLSFFQTKRQTHSSYFTSIDSSNEKSKLISLTFFILSLLVTRWSVWEFEKTNRQCWWRPQHGRQKYEYWCPKRMKVMWRALSSYEICLP